MNSFMLYNCYRITRSFKTMLVKKGVFVAIEGCDRCGKTTQCQLVVKKLNDLGKKVKYLKFPERSTQLGVLINKYLNGTLHMDDYEIHLLFTLNRWEFVKQIKDSLNEGTNLIVDRYAYSGVAYSAVKKDVDLKFCLSAELGLPSPHLTIFLEGSIDTNQGREGFGDEVYERVETQIKVKNFFRSYLYSLMETANAEGSIEEVNNRLMKVITNKLDDDIDEGLQGLTWKSLNILSEEDHLKYKPVRDAIQKAVEILEDPNDEDMLDNVLDIVRECSSQMRASSTSRIFN